MKLPILIGLLCFSLLFPTGCAQKGATSDAALIGKTSTPNAASNEITNGDASGSTTENGMHLKTSSTIRDVVNHSAFEGFGQFILPLDRGRYDMALLRTGATRSPAQALSSWRIPDIRTSQIAIHQLLLSWATEME
jgi:hypothetical protein